MFRIGYGNDIHRLVPDRPLIVGGVEIPSQIGAEGHSDADVLTHAVTDAILGALALGDIGTHFSDTDERWRGADSFVFLRYVIGFAKERSLVVCNVDSTISLETPKLRPHIDQMRENLSIALEVETDRISVKAKTGEGIDSIGTGKAIRADAVVLLESL